MVELVEVILNINTLLPLVLTILQYQVEFKITAKALC